MALPNRVMHSGNVFALLMLSRCTANILQVTFVAFTLRGVISDSFRCETSKLHVDYGVITEGLGSDS
jgi:hypothetical protein